MNALARGLSKNKTPEEVAAREACIAALNKSHCMCRAKEFFAETITKKLDEQREHGRANGRFFKDAGKGYTVEPGKDKFTINVSYEEDGNSYSQEATWNRKKAKLTISECKTH